MSTWARVNVRNIAALPAPVEPTPTIKAALGASSDHTMPLQPAMPPQPADEIIGHLNVDRSADPAFRFPEEELTSGQVLSQQQAATAKPPQSKPSTRSTRLKRKADAPVTLSSKRARTTSISSDDETDNGDILARLDHRKLSPPFDPHDAPDAPRTSTRSKRSAEDKNWRAIKAAIDGITPIPDNLDDLIHNAVQYLGKGLGKAKEEQITKLKADGYNDKKHEAMKLEEQLSKATYELQLARNGIDKLRAAARKKIDKLEETVEKLEAAAAKGVATKSTIVKNDPQPSGSEYVSFSSIGGVAPLMMMLNAAEELMSTPVDEDWYILVQAWMDQVSQMPTIKWY